MKKMKKIILCALLFFAYANGYENENYGIHEPIVAKVKNVNTGHSTQTRKQDSYGNYAFSYDEQHHDGGSSRQETGDAHGNKHGIYSLNIGDGRQRYVKYIADDYGFRATIKTNEPGIISQSPASIYIISPHAKSYNGYAEFSNHGVPAYAPAEPAYTSSIQPYGHPVQATKQSISTYENSVPVYVDSSAYNYGPISKYGGVGIKENHGGYNSYEKYNRAY